MAKDVSHTFNAASVVLLAPMDFFMRVFFTPVGNYGPKTKIQVSSWFVGISYTVPNPSLNYQHMHKKLVMKHFDY